jgi:hypothetical protein
MKTLQGLVLAISALTALSASAITKDEVVRDAIKKGAIVVVCDNGLCKDYKTREVVGEGQNGMYLMYPKGHEEEEKQTARLLANAE